MRYRDCILQHGKLVRVVLREGRDDGVGVEASEPVGVRRFRLVDDFVRPLRCRETLVDAIFGSIFVRGGEVELVFDKGSRYFDRRAALLRRQGAHERAFYAARECVRNAIHGLLDIACLVENAIFVIVVVVVISFFFVFFATFFFVACRLEIAPIGSARLELHARLGVDKASKLHRTPGERHPPCKASVLCVAAFAPYDERAAVDGRLWHDRKRESREELPVHLVDRAVLCVDDQLAIVDFDALVYLAVARVSAAKHVCVAATLLQFGRAVGDAPLGKYFVRGIRRGSSGLKQLSAWTLRRQPEAD